MELEGERGGVRVGVDCGGGGKGGERGRGCGKDCKEGGLFDCFGMGVGGVFVGFGVDLYSGCCDVR